MIPDGEENHSRTFDFRESGFLRRALAGVLWFTLLLSLYFILKVHYNSPMVILTYNRLSHATWVLGHPGSYPIDAMSRVARRRPASVTISRLQAFVDAEHRASSPEVTLASDGAQLLLAHGSTYFISDCVLLPLAIVYLPAIGSAGALVFLCVHQRYRARRNERAALRSECLRCGYNLHGLPEPRCPVCGTPFERPGAVWTT